MINRNTAPVMSRMRLKILLPLLSGFFSRFFLPMFTSFPYRSEHVLNADVRAERHERYCRELEELLSQRNSDDRKAEHRADNKVRQSSLPSYEYDPQDVAERRREAHVILNVLTEGRSRESRQLKALNAERDAHDRDAAQKSRHKQLNKSDKTAENKPQKISDNSHINILPCGNHYSTGCTCSPHTARFDTKSTDSWGIDPLYSLTNARFDLESRS